MARAGIIDLGSNSVRMSVVETKSQEVIYQGKIAIKLSEGMNLDMILKEEPILRCTAALLKLKAIMERLNTSEIYAVATAAVRKAKNREEFLKRIKRDTGIEIRILSGAEEARLDFLGVMSKTNATRAVILDTGGGSTEIIGAKDGKMTNAKSIQIGSRSIKELFFDKGETKDAKIAAQNRVKEFFAELSWLDELKGATVIGIGGCNRTLARICLAESEKDAPIESYELSRDKVFEIFGKIEWTKPEERGKIAGITSDRTDIIYGGLLPLIELMTKLESPRLIVTDGGLRDGIASELKNL